MNSFMAENGWYIAIKTRLGGYCGAFRNALLSKKLGARPLNIGPDAHLLGLSHIRIGKNFSSGRGLWLQAVTERGGERFSPKIIIGDDVDISFWTTITAVNYVEVGSRVLIASKVTILDHNHGAYSGEEHTSPLVPPSQRRLSRGRVVIGNDVWIGEGAVVGPGSEIGEGSIIGSNSVVKGVIPAFTIAVGAPARPIKRYDFNKLQWVRV
ncbi:MAG: hypothetical protein WA700_04255 [Acidobacteriaceae bacterium]